MTNESNRQHPSIPGTEQPSLLDETHSNDKDKKKLRDTNIQTNSEHVADVYSLLIGDLQQTKRYLLEIAHHSRSTIELLPDGSIVVTPHPRQLPNEIIGLILNHVSDERQTLYECTLATKQFHMMSYPLLWQLPVDLPNNDIFDRFLTCISSPPQQYPQPAIGHAIRHLCVDGCHWTDDHLLRLLPHIPLLHHLTVTSHHITDASFQHVPRQCKHLASLQLAHTILTQASFSALGRHAHHLRDLDWRISTKQLPEWLALLLRCPLERLRLRIASGHVRLNQKTLTSIKKYHRLTSLEITLAPDNGLALLLKPSITKPIQRAMTVWPPPQPIHHAPTWWPPLTHLTLDPCNDLDDATLLGFLKTHPHLRHLDLTFAGRLTDTSLHNLVAWLPHLTSLAIVGNTNFTPHGIRRYVQASPPSQASVQLFSCARNVGNQFPESTLSFGTAVNLDRKDILAIKMAKQAS